MFKNKTSENKNNICGEKVRKLRQQRGDSQRIIAEALQLQGIDVDKNAIQRIESGQRFVTDIELKALCIVFGISADELLR